MGPVFDDLKFEIFNSVNWTRPGEKDDLRTILDRQRDEFGRELEKKRNRERGESRKAE